MDNNQQRECYAVRCWNRLIGLDYRRAFETAKIVRKSRITARDYLITRSAITPRTEKKRNNKLIIG
jgi:hypothetical protein